MKELDFYQLPPAATHMKNVLHVRTLQALHGAIGTITGHLQARSLSHANASTFCHNLTRASCVPGARHGWLQ